MSLPAWNSVTAGPKSNQPVHPMRFSLRFRLTLRWQKIRLLFRLLPMSMPKCQIKGWNHLGPATFRRLNRGQSNTLDLKHSGSAWLSSSCSCDRHNRSWHEANEVVLEQKTTYCNASVELLSGIDMIGENDLMYGSSAHKTKHILFITPVVGLPCQVGAFQGQRSESVNSPLRISFNSENPMPNTVLRLYCKTMSVPCLFPLIISQNSQ